MMAIVSLSENPVVPVLGDDVLRAVKTLALLSIFSILGACSTINGKTASSSGEGVADIYSNPKVVELQTKVARLQTENARLSNRVMELERTQKSNAQVAATEQDQPSDEESDSQPAAVVALREPTDLPDAVIDNPEAPEIAQSNVPVESAPRLTQPTFAATDSVFENEAETQTASASGALFGVHLASYRGADEARSGWRKLQRDNPDELGLLEPRLEDVEVEDKGRFLRLIGGGLSSREKAEALCANLQSKGLYCSVADFNGKRLSLTETG